MLVVDRLQRYAQSAADRWINPIAARRHPGPVLQSILRLFGPVVKVFNPNDCWNLGSFMNDWIRVLQEPNYEPRPAPKRIFMFTCYRSQLTYECVLALMLAWRGHKVTLAYLPKLQYPSRTFLEDGLSAKNYLRGLFAWLSKHSNGRVIGVDLSEWRDFSGELDETFLAR